MEPETPATTVQAEQHLDLSKTVPISAEEELKLGAFLLKFQDSIKGDQEMQSIFGNTINQWSNQIEVKHSSKPSEQLPSQGLEKKLQKNDLKLVWDRQSKGVNALRPQELVQVFDISFHDFVDVGEVADRFTCFVDDEAGTPLVREVLNALSREYFDKLYVTIPFGDAWQVEVDEPTKLIAVLVEMQHNEGLRVGLGDFPQVLTPRYFDDLSVQALGNFFLDFFHAIGHVLSGELIIEICLSLFLPKSSSIQSSCSSFILSNLFYNLFSSLWISCIFVCSSARVVFFSLGRQLPCFTCRSNHSVVTPFVILLLT